MYMYFKLYVLAATHAFNGMIAKIFVIQYIYDTEPTSDTSMHGHMCMDTFQLGLY